MAIGQVLEHPDLDSAPLGIVAYHLEPVRRDEHRDVDDTLLAGLATVDPHSACDSLGCCGRGVVHRDVRYRQPDEFTDHGLELPHRLQHALADLRLVGSVGSQELAACGKHADHRGNVIPGQSCGEEAGPLVKAHIGAQQSLGVGPDLLLGLGLAQRQRAVAADGCGYVREQFVDGLHAHAFEHLLLASEIRQLVQCIRLPPLGGTKGNHESLQCSSSWEVRSPTHS